MSKHLTMTKTIIVVAVLVGCVLGISITPRIVCSRGFDVVESESKKDPIVSVDMLVDDIDAPIINYFTDDANITLRCDERRDSDKLCPLLTTNLSSKTCTKEYVSAKEAVKGMEEISILFNPFTFVKEETVLCRPFKEDEYCKKFTNVQNQSIVINQYGDLVENTFHHPFSNSHRVEWYDVFAVNCNDSSFAVPDEDYCVGFDEKEYFYVYFDLNHEVSMEDLKVTEILLFLEAQCGVSSSDVRIVYHYDSAGFLIYVLVIVENKTNALAIAVAAKELAKEEGCDSLMCRATDIQVFSSKEKDPLSMPSGSTFSHDSLSLLTVFLMIIAVALY